MTDFRFPSPGVDERFPSPGVDNEHDGYPNDERFPAPGTDTRFDGNYPGSSPISANIDTRQALFVGQDQTDVNADTTSTASYSSTAGSIVSAILSDIGPYVDGDNIFVTVTDSEGNTRIFTVDPNVQYAAAVNTVPPVASGNTGLGDVLSVTNGTWTGATGGAFSYQWRRNGAAIAGATSTSYTIVQADSGKDLTCTVTYTNSGGAVPAVSNARTADTFTAPVISGVPTISGTVAVGAVLTATRASVTGTPTPTPTGQWTANGVNIGAATANTFTITSAQIGAVLRFLQTETNAIGADTALSAATIPVPDADVTDPLINEPWATSVDGTHAILTMSENVSFSGTPDWSQMVFDDTINAGWAGTVTSGSVDGNTITLTLSVPFIPDDVTAPVGRISDEIDPSDYGYSFATDTSDTSTMFTLDVGGVVVVADDPVGRIEGEAGFGGVNLVQATASSRPAYRSSGMLDFDGVADHLRINGASFTGVETMYFGAVFQAPNTIPKFMMMRGFGASQFVGAAENGSSSAINSNVGVPTTWVNGVQITDTRDALYDAITTNSKVFVEIRNLSLNSGFNNAVVISTSSTFFLDGLVGDMFLMPQPDAAAIGRIQDIVDAKHGITFP